MPKVRRLKRYLPKGVMKVVRGHDSGFNRICQNPDRVSSLVNTFASDFKASVWSTAGRMWRSLFTAAFSGVRSTQILSLSFMGFGTKTIPEHQAVGSVTFEIDRMFSILSSSSCTFSISGRGTRLLC